MKNSKNNTHIIYDRLIFYLYASLFLFTPLLIYHKTSELFEFNKMLFIYFITVCILFIWIVKMIIYKKIIIKKTFLDVPLLLFFITQLIATIFSIDRHTSFFGYYGRFNGGLLSLLAYLILFYAFVSTISRHSDIFNVLKISIFSSIAVIVIGLPGRFGYDFLCGVFTGALNNSCWTDQFQPALRMFSTLGQPNWLGAYLAIHFFMGIYFLMRSYDKRRFHTILYALYIVLNFSALLFTRSRSALFAVAIGLLLLLVNILISKKSLIKPAFYMILLLFIPLLIFKTGILKIDTHISFSHPSSTSASNNVSSITDSFDIRKIVWRGAWDLAFRYPWFGSGVETFAYSYYFTRPLGHNLTSEWDFIYNKAHNEYLNYAATTGFVGLGMYLIFIITFIWWTAQKFPAKRVANDPVCGDPALREKIKSEKSKVANSLYLILLLSWITILITNFFGFSTSTINLFFFLIPGFFIVFSHSPQSKYQKISPLVLWQKCGLLINSFILIGAIVFLIGYFIGDISYARAQEYGRADRYDEAVSLLDRALRIHYEHVYQDKLSSYLATEAYLSLYQKKSNVTQKLILLADQYNTYSLRASPDNLHYWRTRAKNYFLFYQMTSSKKYFDQAIASFNRASLIAPTDPKTVYMTALVYSYVYDEEKDKKIQDAYSKIALDTLNRAIQLKRDYRDAYMLKGQLLKKYGRKDEALEVFEHILKNINPNDEKVKKEMENLN